MEYRLWKCDGPECPQQIRAPIATTRALPAGWFQLEASEALATARGVDRLAFTFCSLPCVKTFAEKSG